MPSGYVWRDGQLLYSRETLKCFGLLRSPPSDVETGSDAIETLVHREAKWWGSRARRNLVSVGRIVGECVEPCTSRPWDERTVLFCDRMLGERPLVSEPNARDAAERGNGNNHGRSEVPGRERDDVAATEGDGDIDREEECPLVLGTVVHHR